MNVSEQRYEPEPIETKWQRVWSEERTWEVANPGEPGSEGSQPKAYVLEMLPYPSGEPHVGHLKVYSVGDAVAHFRRRNGYEVIHPMGYDAFGLPAENHAIRTGEHPRTSTGRSIEEFREQFKRWGISIDWTREVSTHWPSYYRWTQWIFLRLYEQGLAYRSEAAVQWCPKDATVLANEQVVEGRCERCGTLVEPRRLKQWFFKITDYADRLLTDFDLLESWPENVVTMQRNWIGRSEGAEAIFRCAAVELDFEVFTTRPDTLFGATFFVLAPEHPEIERLIEGTDNVEEVREYVAAAMRASAEDRGDEAREKTGVRIGRTVTNPVNGEEIPVYVADYVLMEYGTGAIMAVPAHDERDFEFATKFGLEIRPVVEPAEAAGGPGSEAGVPGGEAEDVPAPVGEAFLSHSENDRAINSGEFSGRPSPEVKREIVAWLRSVTSVGRRSTTGSATGCSPASATGVAQSRSSTARPAASSRSPTSSFPSSYRRSRSTSRRGRAHWRRQAIGSRRVARVARVRLGARPTRWTPSSIPPGISSATSTPTTRSDRSTARSPTTGCRSTSTSAASSTRSCT